MDTRSVELKQSLTTWHVFVTGVALVVAATTLVSDFSGWQALGFAFVTALAMAFLVNLFLAASVCELAAMYPRAGAIYEFASVVLSEGGRGTRTIGLFLAVLLYGAMNMASGGEITAGALALRQLVGSDASASWFIVWMGLMAMIPNLFALSVSAWVSSVVLIAMLGLRCFFGVVGFIGLSQTGGWSLTNLLSGSVGVFDLGQVMSGGLGLAFWTFVGIEVVCPLAEELKNPARALPKGTVWGLVCIGATSLVMGLGVMGTLPHAEWTAIMAGPTGCAGECPQLAVGRAMLGERGELLMSIASVTATYGSMVVLWASFPRILFALARERHLPGIFTIVAQRSGTPYVAVLFTSTLGTTIALASSRVVDWVLSAAYVLIILYAVYHVLVLVGRWTRPRAERPVRLPTWVPVLGLVTTLITHYFAFAGGGHVTYGGRALVLVAVAGLIALASLRRPQAAAAG